jgi:hypothetical protein
VRRPGNLRSTGTVGCLTGSHLLVADRQPARGQGRRGCCGRVAYELPPVRFPLAAPLGLDEVPEVDHPSKVVSPWLSLRPFVLSASTSAAMVVNMSIVRLSHSAQEDAVHPVGGIVLADAST